MSTKTKSKTPAKVIGTRKFKLSELTVDGLAAVAKGMNVRIRAAHKEKSKALLAQVKKDEKEKLEKVKTMLSQKLKDTLIKVAKRKKADLIKDIMKNKEHLPPTAVTSAKQEKAKSPEAPEAPEAPEVDMSAETTDEEDEEDEKPKYITRRIGGKIRRIPVSQLAKAKEKKEEKKPEPPKPKPRPRKEPPKPAPRKKKEPPKAAPRPAPKPKPSPKPTPKPEPKATTQDKQIARIGSTRLRTKLAARFDIKAEAAEKKKAESKKPEPKKRKEAFTVTRADGTKVQLYYKEGKEPKAAAKAAPAAAAAPAKAAPAKDSELKKLKKELKSKGVPAAALKFIKTVAQAKSKLEEIEEAEPEDVKVEISPKVLQQIPMKNQAKIKKLIKKVLPRDEFTLQDQVEYFNDLKEMGENWNMSSIPRQRYDKFDPDEKQLFELLYPAIFDKKAKKKAGEAKRAERKAKDE